MNKKIAVESNLTPYKDFLASKGYQVETININDEALSSSGSYNAYIITGMNSNVLGINDTSTKSVVIDASGLTPEQVYNQLQSRLS